MFGLISCSKKERKKQVCVILEEGAYLQVSKVKKKKSLPTDPNFEDHAIGNTHIFLFGPIIYLRFKRGCHRARGWNQQIMMLENGQFYHSMYLS